MYQQALALDPSHEGAREGVQTAQAHIADSQRAYEEIWGAGGSGNL